MDAADHERKRRAEEAPVNGAARDALAPDSTAPFPRDRHAGDGTAAVGPRTASAMLESEIAGPSESDPSAYPSSPHVEANLVPAVPSDAEAVPTKRTLAAILISLADDTSRERVSVADLVAVMQDRAFGALMLIFAMPNALPTPPGTSAILGAPLVFLAAQLMLGRKPWLPKIIANRSMARGDFATMIGKAAPWIAWAEKLLKPRLEGLARPPAEYVVGAVCLLMATILFLPIPLGNMLPALAICLFSLGLLERDGVWVLAGLVASVVSCILVSGVVFALVKGGLFLFSQAFG